MVLFNQRKKAREKGVLKMTFKELREVWSGRTRVGFHDKDGAVVVMEGYPFDLVQTDPRLDNFEVRSICPDMYIQCDNCSSCLVKLDYRE